MYDTVSEMSGADGCLGDRGAVDSDGAIAVIGGLVVLAGVALAVTRYVGGTPVERGLEGGLGSVALGALLASPGAMALLSLTSRPALLLPAATLLIPLAFISFAGIALPLLVPAAMLFVAYGRRSDRAASRTGWAVLSTLAVLALLAAAAIALFAHPDPRSYTTPTGGGSTSDVITYTESLLSLALTGSAVAAGWYHTTPADASARQPDRPRPPRWSHGSA